MFEWEEHTFLGIKSLYERFVSHPKKRAAEAVRAQLSDHRQRLFLLAQMAAGRPVALFETDDIILCDPERIFLPSHFSSASSVEANLAFYEIKTLLGGLAIQQGWVGDQTLLNRLPQIEEAFPRLPEHIEQVITAFKTPEHFWETLGTVRPSKEATASASQIIPKSSDQLDDKIDETEITEIEGRGQLDVISEADREDDGSGHEMPIHTFEKAETLEEHSGLSRRNDDEDELKDHEEALRHVDMNHVLRSRDRPRSIYRADVLLESVAFESGEPEVTGGTPYPEWDFKTRRYREDWCRVHEAKIDSTTPDWAAETLKEHRGLILSLKKSFAQLANQSLRVKRQPSGSEFDLDALVENRVAWRSGHAADENIYLEQKRQLHDVSALILLDRSYSTEGYIDGRRVLDIIRETMVCVGGVLDEFLEEFAVAAFSSDTRHHCSFDWIKQFSEPWPKSQSRLGELRAAGYTRIGPALRHAHELLERRSAERKVVILITDGRPCDYDRYEGTYGIHDVKHAVATGDAHEIHTHAFAIETRARESFPAMFKRDHYHIVPEPGALTTSLCDLFSRLKSR